MNGKKSVWARLACWMWIPPVAALVSHLLFWNFVLTEPLEEALFWYFWYFSEYAGVWFGLAAAIISVIAAVVERRAGRNWYRYIACGVGHGLCGQLLWVLFHSLKYF